MPTVSLRCGAAARDRGIGGGCGVAGTERGRPDMAEFSCGQAVDLKRKIAENHKRVEERIAAACAAAKRDRAEVRLIAVTKSVGLDVLKLLPDLGFADLGESRVQELSKRAAVVNEFLSRRARALAGGAMPRPRWHMVGHLQRNKVRSVLPWADLIHSMDSLRLAEEIDAEARRLGRKAEVLLQVNCSGEESKFGVAVGAATHLAELIAPLPNLALVGLMTMAPLTEETRVIEETFVRCRELFEEIYHELDVGPQFKHLSMGMSHDFEIAIACGATMIRVGSALFEGIPQPDPAAA
jgi:pyridoxal phosphate enzyme (YggS family)